MLVSFYLLVLLLGIYCKEIIPEEKSYMQKIFIATLFKTDKNCKQPKCSTWLYNS